jgi:Type II CAAX prenyl endopeptidase Rce1-like
MPVESPGHSPAGGVSAADVLAAGCLLALSFGGSPLVMGLCTYGAVLALGRSNLVWLGMSRPGRLARRLARVAVFLAPLPFVEVNLAATAVPVAIGAGVGIVLLAPDARILARSLFKDVALLGPQSRFETFRDVLLFSTCGAAQEYLYRGVLLAGLAPVVGWWAVPVATALFVAEHAAQGLGGLTFDVHDYSVQAVMGVTLGVLTYQCGGILPALVGHTVYNLPNVVQAVLRYRLHDDPAPDLRMTHA